MAQTLRKGLLALALTLVSCGPSGQAGSPRPKAIMPSSSASPPVASTSPAEPRQLPAVFPKYPLVELPPAIAPYTEIACSLRADGPVHITEGAGGDHEPLKLSFNSSGPPFAEVVSYEKAIVDFRSGPRAHARVTVDVQGGVRVSGLADIDSIDLRPARPFLIGGLFSPKEYTPLRWESGAPGAATISVALRLARGPAELFRAARPCDDISAGWRWFPPPKQEEPWLGNAILPAGVTQLASAPGTRAVASVTLGEKDDRLVSIIAARGAHSRVVIYADQALIIGWVPSSVLSPTNSMVARDFMPPSGMSGIGQHSSPIRVACSAETPLIAEVAGERRTVGSIRARTPIGLDERRDDFCVANFTGPPAALSPAKGARLLVRTGDLAGCDVLPGE